jgi:hypothetical protein
VIAHTQLGVNMSPVPSDAFGSEAAGDPAAFSLRIQAVRVFTVQAH